MFSHIDPIPNVIKSSLPSSREIASKYVYNFIGLFIYLFLHLCTAKASTHYCSRAKCVLMYQAVGKSIGF